MLQRSFLGSLLFVCAAAFAQTSFPDHCPDGSTLPFASIQVAHPIDQSCGVEGAPSAPANSHLQNKVKNNFCATGASGQPEVITPQTLVDLQAKTTIPTGQGKEPSDRTPLLQLGEGKLVRMTAFLYEAHFADLGSGETVNCNGATAALNDVHMAMVSQADDQECASVTAEISPHFRPATWDEIGNYETYNATTKKYTPSAAMDARLRAQAYRITGQLFFDASHEPCPCGTSCTPARASDWEIHPVYAIEVCRAGAKCDVNTDSDWIAFDQWWNSLTPLKKTRGPHRHESERN
jgi:hypothetical protein